MNPRRGSPHHGGSAGDGAAIVFSDVRLQWRVDGDVPERHTPRGPRSARSSRARGPRVRPGVARRRAATVRGARRPAAAGARRRVISARVRAPRTGSAAGPRRAPIRAPSPRRRGSPSCRRRPPIPWRAAKTVSALSRGRRQDRPETASGDACSRRNRMSTSRRRRGGGARALVRRQPKTRTAQAERRAEHAG